MSRFLLWAGLAASALVAAACGGGDARVSASGAGGGADPDAGAPDSGAGDAGMTDAGPPPDPSKPLFEADAIPTFNITLSDQSIGDLNAEPKAYVVGGLEVHQKGEVTALGSIGVRLKGNYGSFRTLDEKAAFLLKFDAFTKDQTLYGLEKLALNNMVQDASMIHERLAYTLFLGVGAPAPRSAYARVTVNGQLYGLYAAVEVVDNPLFLGAWFGGDKGALYEGSYGSDLETGLLPTFDQDNGPDVGLTDLQALVDALDAITEPESFVAEASKVIDLDSYLKFAATEIFLGHWDGYAWTRNNFFVYRRPDDGRWAFIPWGTDQTFDEYLDPFGGDGRLQQMCDASFTCRMKLADAFQEVVARASDLDLIGDALALKALIWDAATEDPRKEYGIGTVSDAIDATIDFLQNRPADVSARLVCADPFSVDADGDGFSPCVDDCDDESDAIHPDADEKCDFVDDDCNGVLDDGPACPACPSQPVMGGGTLGFCVNPKTFQEAEADCVAQGGHLVSLHDQALHDLVNTYAFQVADDQWWVGLNDIASEGAFTWTDGTPFDYTAWAGGEPNDANNEDCAHLANWAGGGWNDIQCSAELRYICYLP
jgi:hypothetical protein